MKVTCDQCVLLIINGVACHEHGCRNAWMNVLVECSWCGRAFNPEAREQKFCESSCQEAYQ